MNYFDAFEKLKKILEKSKIKNGNRHFAIQVCILDPEASGIFYIEDFGDNILAEPYDYYDKDAEILGQVSDLELLFEKKLDFQEAIKNGIITATGDTAGLADFFSRITVKKTATTRKTKKSTESKSTAKKKTETKKTVPNAKKISTKDTETISEVVKKEIKMK